MKVIPTNKKSRFIKLRDEGHSLAAISRKLRLSSYMTGQLWQLYQTGELQRQVAEAELPANGRAVQTVLDRIFLTLQRSDLLDKLTPEQLLGLTQRLVALQGKITAAAAPSGDDDINKLFSEIYEG